MAAKKSKPAKAAKSPSKADLAKNPPPSPATEAYAARAERPTFSAETLAAHYVPGVAPNGEHATLSVNALLAAGATPKPFPDSVVHAVARVVSEALQRTLDGGEDAVRQGSHPFFHDIERVDILKKTQTFAALNPDIARLHEMLRDAHERLAEAGDPADLIAVQKERDEALNESARLEKELEDSKKETAKFQKENTEAETRGHANGYAAGLKEDAVCADIVARGLGQEDALRDVAKIFSVEWIDGATTLDTLRKINEKGETLLSEYVAMSKDGDTATAEAIKWAGEARRLQARVDELAEVEPLATAFAFVCSGADLDVDPDARAAVSAAKAILGLEA